jgi:hypothetical protein
MIGNIRRANLIRKGRIIKSLIIIFDYMGSGQRKYEIGGGLRTYKG